MNTTYVLNSKMDDVAFIPYGMSQRKAKKGNLFWVWLERYLRFWEKIYGLELCKRSEKYSL